MNLHINPDTPEPRCHCGAHLEEHLTPDGQLEGCERTGCTQFDEYTDAEAYEDWCAMNTDNVLEQLLSESLAQGETRV